MSPLCPLCLAGRRIPRPCLGRQVCVGVAAAALGRELSLRVAREERVAGNATGSRLLLAAEGVVMRSVLIVVCPGRGPGGARESWREDRWCVTAMKRRSARWRNVQGCPAARCRHGSAAVGQRSSTFWQAPLGRPASPSSRRSLRDRYATARCCETNGRRKRPSSSGECCAESPDQIYRERGGCCEEMTIRFYCASR